MQEAARTSRLKKEKINAGFHKAASRLNIVYRNITNKSNWELDLHNGHPVGSSKNVINTDNSSCAGMRSLQLNRNLKKMKKKIKIIRKTTPTVSIVQLCKPSTNTQRRSYLVRGFSYINRNTSNNAFFAVQVEPWISWASSWPFKTPHVHVSKIALSRQCTTEIHNWNKIWIYWAWLFRVLMCISAHKNPYFF